MFQGKHSKKHRISTLLSLDLDMSVEVLEWPAPTQGTAMHTSKPTRYSTYTKPKIIPLTWI